jgi:hypothetical protein
MVRYSHAGANREQLRERRLQAPLKKQHTNVGHKTTGWQAQAYANLARYLQGH